MSPPDRSQQQPRPVDRPPGEIHTRMRPSATAGAPNRTTATAHCRSAATQLGMSAHDLARRSTPPTGRPAVRTGAVLTCSGRSDRRSGAGAGRRRRATSTSTTHTARATRVTSANAPSTRQTRATVRNTAPTTTTPTVTNPALLCGRRQESGQSRRGESPPRACSTRRRSVIVGQPSPEWRRGRRGCPHGCRLAAAMRLLASVPLALRFVLNRTRVSAPDGGRCRSGRGRLLAPRCDAEAANGSGIGDSCTARDGRAACSRIHSRRLAVLLGGGLAVDVLVPTRGQVQVYRLARRRPAEMTRPRRSSSCSA